jgi:hypothetical protein
VIIQAAVSLTDRLILTVIDSRDHAIEYGDWVPGGAFSGFTAIGGSSSHAPSLAVFGDRQYMAVKGDTDNFIYLRYRDEQGKWSPWTTIPGGTSSSSPALASFNGRLYVAVRGTTDIIFLCSMDASGNWDPFWTETVAITTESPGLAVFNNRLYLFLKSSWDNSINYRSMDVSGVWSSWFILPGDTDKTMGLSVFNDLLYVFVKGAGNNSIYYRTMNTSGVWNGWGNLGWVNLPGETTEAPSVTVFDGRLYVAVKGATDENVYIRSADSSGWDQFWTLVPANTDKTPVLSTFFMTDAYD